MSLPADTKAYMLHRHPMRLVQRLLCVEGDYCEAETVFQPGALGVDADGYVEAVALVEIVAQAYAAAQGYQARKSVALGMLVGVSDFHIDKIPAAGQRLKIIIRSSSLFDGFFIVEGQVLCEDEILAHGTLKAWEQPEAEAHLP
jgi:3-hydroxyacyl-[acyl-carrier-protein] dehydratase